MTLYDKWGLLVLLGFILLQGCEFLLGPPRLLQFLTALVTLFTVLVVSAMVRDLNRRIN